MSDVVLIPDAVGTVIGASLGQPTPGSLPPGHVAVPRQADE